MHDRNIPPEPPALCPYLDGLLALVRRVRVLAQARAAFVERAPLAELLAAIEGELGRPLPGGDGLGPESTIERVRGIARDLRERGHAQRVAERAERAREVGR